MLQMEQNGMLITTLTYTGLPTFTQLNRLLDYLMIWFVLGLNATLTS